MEFINESYEIVTEFDQEQILKQLERGARICYKSEDKIGLNKCKNATDDWSCKETCKYRQETKQGVIFPCSFENQNIHSSYELIDKIMKIKHLGVIEHCIITVIFTIDRGVGNELVRHRIASYLQESTRYCNYGNNHIKYIIPKKLKNYLEPSIFTKNNNTYNVEYRDNPTRSKIMFINDDPIFDWLESIETSERSYQKLIKKGWSPQDARSVLPLSLKTEIFTTFNLREWREVFRQRTAEAAHPDMKEIMRKLLEEFKLRLPIFFNDINY